MHVHRSSTVIAALGVLLIVAAAIVYWAVAPRLSKLPADLDSTVTMSGTATVLNPEALQAGDFSNLYIKDVPANASQHVSVAQTDGDTAIVHSGITISTENGADVESDHVYAVDRVTLEATDPPDGVEVEPHDGVTVGIGSDANPDEARQFYDPTTGRSYPMEYTGSEELAGRDVLEYDVEAVGKVVDPAILATLPPALPAPAIAGLSTQLPPAESAKVGAGLATMPAEVPITYLQDTMYHLAFDQGLGTPIAVTFDQTITAAVDVNGESIEIMPVMTVSAAPSAETVQSAADAAANASKLLKLAGVAVPLALAALGIIAIAIAYARRRPRSDAAAPSVEQPASTPN